MEKWKLYKEGKIKLPKEEIESYQYSEYRHKQNENLFELIKILGKVAFFPVTIPLWMSEKKKQKRIAEEKEKLRKKRVIESKERARLMQLEYEKELHARKQREKFERIFSSKDDFNILEKKEFENQVVEIIDTNIPLVKWQQKSEELKMLYKSNNIEIGTNEDMQIIIKTSSYIVPKMIEWEDKFLQPDNVYVIGVKTKNGDYLTFDVDINSHSLICGLTNSGKTVILKCIIWQSILKGHVNYGFDFKKGVAMQFFKDYIEVVTDLREALIVLEFIHKEVNKRLDLFLKYRVEDIKQFRSKVKSIELAEMNLFFDEVSAMLTHGINKAENKLRDKCAWYIEDLSKLARCTGIHLWLSTQRLDSTVMKSGQTKNNLDNVICGALNKVSSTTVLGNIEASMITREIKGRFLHQLGNDINHFQALFFKNEDIKKFEYKQQGAVLTDKVVDMKTKELDAVNLDI